MRFILIAQNVTYALLLDAVLDKSKPNVIIIFTDDQGYGDLGCYGAKWV